MAKLKVLEFIKAHDDWREILSSGPYNISINEEDGLIILKYNQLNSNFRRVFVKECRGLILYADTLEPACVPFYKFFNLGEKYANKIDWDSARISEKMDGTLIKVFYRKDKNKWQISTNATINAFNCKIGSFDATVIDEDIPFSSYGELFVHSLHEPIDSLFNRLNKEYTYMFELCSPYNKVVIKYNDCNVWHIGTRNNNTLKEVEMDIGIKKPKEYFFNSIDDCIAASKELKPDQEGYVVRDKNFHRVKIKNPVYLLMHRSINNRVITLRRIIDMIKENETNEFLSYFPEYGPAVDSVKKDLWNIHNYVCNGYHQIKKELGEKFINRGNYARIVMKEYREFSDFFFKIYDDPSMNITEFLMQQETSKIKETIEKWRQYKKTIIL